MDNTNTFSVTAQCTVFIYRKQPRIMEEYHWKKKSDWLWNLADLIQSWGDVYRKRKRHTSELNCYPAVLQDGRGLRVNIQKHTNAYWNIFVYYLRHFCKYCSICNTLNSEKRTVSKYTRTLVITQPLIETPLLPHPGRVYDAWHSALGQITAQGGGWM